MHDLAWTTGALIAYLGLALLVAVTAERMHVPGPVGLVLAGAVFGAIHPVKLPFSFGETLLIVFLPPLIFEAAWNIDISLLSKTIGRVTFLAIPGVLFTAALVGGAIALTGQLPFAQAFVVGAIVAATDPVAVIAIFRRLQVPGELQMIVEGESIANDGVAIVLVSTAVAFAAGTPVDVWGAIGHGALAIGGGVAVGIAAGLLFAFLMGRVSDSPSEIAATIVVAYLSYLIADALGLSGVFATAGAGVTLRAVLRIRPFTRDAEAVDAFWATIAFVANAFVFIATGLVLQLPRLTHEPVLVIAAIAAVVIARVVLALVTVRPWPWRATLVLAGMRGGLGLALALALPDDLPGRPQIIDAVFGVVFFTLVAQGFALEPVLRRMGFAPS